MATASVVEQHPGLDSEPLLRVFKPVGGRKKITLPRKSSWEKMMFRRSSGSENGSLAAQEDTGPHPLSAGEAAVKGGMPGEGCGAPSASTAPRSPDRSRQEGSTQCDRRTSGGTRGGPAGYMSTDYNSNIESESDRSTGGRRGASLMRSGTNVMTNTSMANGYKGAHRHRDAPHGRRDTFSGHQGICSSVSEPEESGGLQLERLTQGRTGVVRLARSEPHRREAWSIFPQGVDPRVRTERGEGHRFEAKPVAQDWCDTCSRQITAQALECQNCSYTCHLECERQVQLDCNQRDKEPEDTPPPRSHRSTTEHKTKEAKEEESQGTKDLSEEEVRTRIDEYNSQISKKGMSLASDGSYTGFIKVHLRLSRPVTVPSLEVSSTEVVFKQLGSQTQALSEAQEGTDFGQSEKRTSFYLPCDCVKQVHISSWTTTGEVIQGLLKKFMVLDNPQKFALYRQTHRDGQDLFQKLPLCERPLLLRLIAGPDPEQLSFVLKENETGEVEWHAFSVPELQNFLVILEKEEADRVRAVENKYSAYRKKLQQALQKHDP
ncbi:ras association domain-containing protein 5 [Aulostomus maculatus]